MDICDSAFRFASRQQTWGPTRRYLNRGINNSDIKRQSSGLYRLCSTTHQHSLHWQLHCIPTSSSISSRSTSAAKHLQHPRANTHARTPFKQTLPCLWHVTVQRVYAWRSPVQTIMIIKSRLEAVEVIVPRKS